MQIDKLSSESVVKLHTLAFNGVQIRDFTANRLLLEGVNPTVWTLGYAIPYHTNQLLEKLGCVFGLNSMHGREAKHVKLAKYVENTCNVKKSMRWWIVFRHEFVCLLWLREMDPYSVSYRQEKKKGCDSYIPNRVKDNDTRFCYCGFPKLNANDEGCTVCTGSVMQLVKQSVATGKVNTELKQFLKL